jgi:hypothetical protein
MLDRRLAIQAFTVIENSLMDQLLLEEVGVISTTLTGAGTTRILNRPADHTIIQETFLPPNGDIFIGMAGVKSQKQTIHVSSDAQQLKGGREDVTENCFAKLSNPSIVYRYTQLGYPTTTLNEQYRLIPELAKIASDIFYGGQVVTLVDISKRPDIPKATKALTKYAGIRKSYAFINISGSTTRVGPTRSKQNELEAQIAVSLAKNFISEDIAPNRIIILSAYIVQTVLIRKTITSLDDADLERVTISTVNAYQDSENSVVIFLIATDKLLGFMSEPSRLLVAITRGLNSLVILAN